MTVPVFGVLPLLTALDQFKLVTKHMRVCALALRTNGIKLGRPLFFEVWPLVRAFDFVLQASHAIP